MYTESACWCVAFDFLAVLLVAIGMPGEEGCRAFGERLVTDLGFSFLACFVCIGTIALHRSGYLPCCITIRNRHCGMYFFIAVVSLVLNTLWNIYFPVWSNPCEGGLLSLGYIIYWLVTLAITIGPTLGLYLARDDNYELLPG